MWVEVVDGLVRLQHVEGSKPGQTPEELGTEENEERERPSQRSRMN